MVCRYSLWLAGLLAACGGNRDRVAAPTWAQHVAPLVHRSCAPCHRPGQPAPFALLSYEDARKKSRQIAEVTNQRVMPPWLMVHGDFLGDRRLTTAEITLLQDWVAAGAPRGDASREPAPPQWSAEWQLGEPDLVLELQEAFPVPAAGPNLFRNFVVPVALERLRHVEAVEIRPLNPAVHHAVLAVDATSSCRQLDAADAEPGFPGMVAGAALPPDGHFLGWTPGKRVRREPTGMAWRLRPGDDLVLQLHLVPTGKVERVQPRIGLYFTDQPTTIEPFPLALFSEQIDIAAGDADFVLRDQITLPVPVVVHRVYPHAHYLGRRLRAWIQPPGGAERDLFRIDAWDFDWQDDYEFAQPVELPAGTTLGIEYHYDNSDGNPSNPHRPPARVRFGQASEDEMGTLTLMLTTDPGRPRLQLAAAVWQHDCAKCPRDPGLWRKLAGVQRELGQDREALASLAAAMERAPEHPETYYELGMCHERAGRFDAAERAYRAALRTAPDHGGSNLQLGGLLARAGQTEPAIRCFELALQSLPNLPLLHCNLGTAYFAKGDLAAAEARYRRALALDDRYVNAWFLFGRMLAAQGRRDPARSALQRALQLAPGHPGAQAAWRELGG
jgi:Flp pilus assembly protein TadD